MINVFQFKLVDFSILEILWLNCPILTILRIKIVKWFIKFWCPHVACHVLKHCRGVSRYFWMKKLFINITMAIATIYYGHFSITLHFRKKTVLLPRVVFSLNFWPMRKPIKCSLMLWTNTMKRVMLFGAMTTILCSFQNA